MRTNPCNKQGFTLVEVLITLLILAIGMLASTVGIMKAFDQSLRNEMRSEAIKIAQEQQEAVRNMDYATIPQIPAYATPGGVIINRQIRKTTLPFHVTCSLPAPPAALTGMGARLIVFTVTWQFQNKPAVPYSYVLQTIRRQLR